MTSITRHTIHIGIRIFLVISIFTCCLQAIRNHQDCPTAENTLVRVVQSVRAFARSSENPGLFTMELKRTIASFHLAAGLDTVVKGYGDSSFQRTTSADVSFLIPTSMSFCHLPPAFPVGEIITANKTYSTSPRVPPPRFA